MRTFAIIVGTIVVCLLVGFTGFWIGNGGLAGKDAIMANVTERGDLEITSLHRRQIEIIAVTFNDAEYNDVCASRPNPVFWTHGWNPNWQNGGWYVRYAPVSLREGDVVFALYNPRACGERIVKADVITDVGTYVFRYPNAAKSRGNRPNVTPLTLDRWFDLR